MAKLTYLMLASLDGYIEDEKGEFGWAEPDAEVHSFVNDLVRPVGTHLCGRRMYETMVWWETVDTGPEQDAVTRDYAAIWRSADKVVFSKTLRAAESERTVIESAFEPEAIAQLKASSERDISIGGPELAGQAIAAGLLDELHLLLVPVSVGGGKPVLPTGVHLPLELLDERRFTGGTVYVHYRVVPA